MNNLNKTIVNLFAGGIGYAIPITINIFATPILLKFLGAEGFGLQNLVNVVIGYFAFMEMGIDLPIIKYLSEDIAKKRIKSVNDLLSTTLVYYITIGFVGMTVAFLLSKYLAYNVFEISDAYKDKAVSVFILTGIGFFGQILFSWGKATMVGIQRLDLANLVSIFNSIIGVGGGLVLLYSGGDIVGFIALKVVVPFLLFLVYFFYIKQELVGFKFNIIPQKSVFLRIKEYLGFGFLNRILGVFQSLDRTFVGMLIAVSSIPFYAIPFLVTNSISLFIDSILKFIIPMSSELTANNQISKLHELTRNAQRLVTAISVLMFMPMYVFSENILTIWISKEFAKESTNIFRILIIASFLGTISVTLLNQVLVGIGRIKVYTYYNIIRTGIVIITLYIFINLFGVIGAAYSIFLGSIVSLFFSFYAMNKILHLQGVEFYKTVYFVPIFLGLVLSFLMNFIYTSNFIIISIGLAVFYSLYFLIGFRINVFGNIEKAAIIHIYSKALELIKKN